MKNTNNDPTDDLPDGTSETSPEDDLSVFISGGIWETSPVSETPEIVLTSWSVRQLADGDRHFVGCNSMNREGRVSSKIEIFDGSSRRGITASGRVYELRGRPGWTSDADYTWRRWLSLNNVPADSWSDVTAEILKTDVNADTAANFARMCDEKSHELARKELGEDDTEADDFGTFRGSRRQ